MYSNLSLTNQYDYTFNINPSAPPDNGATLTSGQTVYIAIIHKSSPSLKWDENRSLVPYQPTYELNGEPYIMIPVTVPVDVCNYYTYIYNQNANMYRESSTVKGVGVNLEIKVDVRAQFTATFVTEFSKNSAFDVDVQTLSSNQIVTPNSTPGTYEIKNVYYNATPSNYFSAGNTVYYRSRISSTIGSVTHSTAWTSTKSLVVTNQLPL